MKFRNKETGEVTEGLFTTISQKCRKIACSDCILNKYRSDSAGVTCSKWIMDNPEKAAALMGYEVIEDESDDPQEAKADGGKPRPTLVPVSLINAVTAIREFGCQKYHDPENWRKVEPQRYRDALYRHWLAYLGGEKTDPESGMPHLWHLACNVAFLIEMEEEKK